MAYRSAAAPGTEGSGFDAARRRLRTRRRLHQDSPECGAVRGRHAHGALGAGSADRIRVRPQLRARQRSLKTGGHDMRYKLKPIQCRPWTLSYLSVKLIESHYENNYGGALRRLNAITEQLESLDFANTPGHVPNGLKREELVALNSTLLHELYFASMGGDGQPTKAMSEILARDFGSLDRWRAEFRAMGYALGGGSGWVLLTYVPRDGRLINQYAAEHSQAVASGVPILALDMYEDADHMDFGANARAYVDTFLRNVDWPALELRYEDAAKVPGPRLLEQPEFGDVQGIGVEEVKEMMAAGKPVQVIDVRPRAAVSRLHDIADG